MIRSTFVDGDQALVERPGHLGFRLIVGSTHSIGRPRKPLRLLICSTEISPAILVDRRGRRERAGQRERAADSDRRAGRRGGHRRGRREHGEDEGRRGGIPPLTGRPLRDHAIEESLRRPLAPLRHRPSFRRDQGSSRSSCSAGRCPTQCSVHPTPRVGP